MSVAVSIPSSTKALNTTLLTTATTVAPFLTACASVAPESIPTILSTTPLVGLISPV